MSDVLIYCIVVGSAVVGGVIQNVAGFGASIVMLAVLSRFFPPVTASCLNQAICMGTTVILAVKYRKNAVRGQYMLPALCFVATSVATIYLVSSNELHWLGAAMGAFMVLLAVYSLFIQKNLHITPTTGIAVTFGLISGVLSGLFSIGATLMALYFLAISEDRDHYMGNLQTQLAICNIVSISMRAVRGIFTADMIPMTLLGFGGILIGQLIGGKFSNRINKDLLKKIVYILVAITGILTIVKQVRLM